MTDDNKDEVIFWDLVRDVPRVIDGSSRGPVPIDPAVTVIGTSSSTDYLKDTTGNQRLWPVIVPSETPPDDGQVCDGIHDESAPAHHLCSRCFPNGRDLVDPTDDDEDRHDDQETE